MALDLGRHDRVTEVAGPRAYEVRTGARYLHGLEDGEIRHWPEYHLFIVDERTGSLMIEGGYGTFSYAWPNRARDGESLHAFLYDLDFDYFMGKASKQPHRVNDDKRTLRELKVDLLKRRREEGSWSGGQWTKDVVREMWDDLLGWESDYRGDDLVRKLFEDGAWSEFLDYSDPSYTKEHPGLRRFWDEVWATFRRQVLREHWLDHVKRRPLPRRRALVSIEHRFDRIAA